MEEEDEMMDVEHDDDETEERDAPIDYSKVGRGVSRESNQQFNYEVWSQAVFSHHLKLITNERVGAGPR